MPRGAQEDACNPVIATWRCCHTGVQSLQCGRACSEEPQFAGLEELAEQGSWRKELAVKHSRIAQDAFTALTRDSSCLYSVEALLPAPCDQRDICF